MGNYSNVECGMGNAGFWNLDFGFGIIRMLIAECGMRNGIHLNIISHGVHREKGRRYFRILGGDRSEEQKLLKRRENYF